VFTQAAQSLVGRMSFPFSEFPGTNEVFCGALIDVWRKPNNMPSPRSAIDAEN
jgi:hypothetical protein